MKKIGLIGENLSHSYSEEIHRQLHAPYSYTLCPMPLEELSGFFRTTDLDGFNVTIPYKKAVIPYLSGCSETAARCGSINTVLRTRNGWYGYNTDYAGFSYMLSRSGLDVSGKKVLVLGSGGVCPTVCAVLADRGAHAVVISRRGEDNYTNLERHADARMIVNATPVGMYPGNGVSPVPLDGFPSLEGVLDLIYNPFETALTADARKRGLTAVCGISMLTAQAKQAMTLFSHGGTANAVPETEEELTYPDTDIERVTSGMVKSMRNIILIGMPGCGKTTLGRKLARELGREFADADEVFAEKYGITPAEMITEQGEASFREAEHTVLEMLCARSSLVIATGGGCVTREDNLAPMQSNGIPLYLDRPVSGLSTHGRPLSLKTPPEVLFAQREQLYLSFADAVVPNLADSDTVVRLLIEASDAVPYTKRICK